MALPSWLRWKPVSVPDASTTAAPILDFLYTRTLEKSHAELWREQPHLRTVIDFLARNTARLGLQAFERQPDGGRERLRDSILDTLLLRPNAAQTGFELVRTIVADLALYDNAYLMVLSFDRAVPIELRTIRPTWIQAVNGPDAYAVKSYVVKFPDTTQTLEVPADKVIHFHGWNPLDERVGVSPVSALKATLAEQIHATRFREQLWQRGGRVGSYVHRPKDATELKGDARAKFQRQFNEAWAGDSGAKAGGMPLMDEGMEIRRVGFSAREEQFIEATKLSLATVAAVYHVNPTMVGLLDNANYSNVREFRRMLYGETLGPTLTMIEQRLNAFLLPLLGFDPRTTYVEFNVDALLRGSQEEQAAVASSAVGVPYMTVNEYRALQNLPALDGGDDLVQPLNVTQNGDHDPVPAAETTPADPTDPDQQFMRELNELVGVQEGR